MSLFKQFYLLMCCLFICVNNVQAQEFNYTNQQLKNANTASEISYLNNEEINFIFYTNLLRTNPKIFANTYVKHYLDSAKFAASIYIKSLTEYLLEAEPMHLLNPDKQLYNEAMTHANDMGKSGIVGHNSSNGKLFEERLKIVSNYFDIVQENCQYGYAKGLDILMDLLIDEGIEDYGHRYTLMNSRLRFIGVSIQPHKKYNVNCVIDFGGKKLN